MSVAEQLTNNGALAALLAKSTWSERADVWLEDLLPGDTFTSEDLIKAIGLPDETTPNANNAVGAKIRAWSYRKNIAHRGYSRTTRLISHARVIALWEKK